MHSIFSVKSVFLGSTAATCENMLRSSMDGFPQVRLHGWKLNMIPSATAQVGAAWWPLWLDPCRVTQLPGARDLESLVEGWYRSIASPYATQRRKQKDHVIETLKSAQKHERIRRGNLVGIRIEVRLVRKPFKK